MPEAMQCPLSADIQCKYLDQLAEAEQHIASLQALAEMQLSQSCHFERRMVDAEEAARHYKREARTLRAIVQEDHPDELVLMRGMREYHAKERSRRRNAEERIDTVERRHKALRALMYEALVEWRRWLSPAQLQHGGERALTDFAKRVAVEG
jgi:hypothetical protein